MYLKQCFEMVLNKQHLSN